MFAVEDLDDMLARLRARGATLVGEVVRYENAYRPCYIRGPEGILLGLAEELGLPAGAGAAYVGRMHIGRREFLWAAGAVIAGVAVTAAAGEASVLDTADHGAPHPRSGMYGLIGKMMAVPGKRDALIAILLEGTTAMPGCLSYVVARDPAEADAVWVTEVWESQAAHAASLALPAVREAIARGRPLIAGFSSQVVTEPVGGHGLAG
jgi:quinol monooxygenase YgiN